MRRIGAHLSISGGLDKAVESCVNIGGNALQIFSSSPRIWRSKLPDQAEIDRFNQLVKKDGIGPIFIHAKYLINLASDKMELVEKSIESLKFDLQVGGMIKAKGVIVHLGSHLGRGFVAVQNQVEEGIKTILQASQGQTKFLIENSAGQKGKLCSQFSEIRLLLTTIHDSRLGWCYDTCHGYNSGYLLGKNSVNSLIQFDMIEEAKKLGLLKSLACLHVNDSRDQFNSGHDRHANLGEGSLGLEGIKVYVNQPELNHLPLIIETPGFEGNGPDKKNLDILKSLIDE